MRSLESWVKVDEGRTWFFSERVKTDVMHKSFELEYENRKLREALSESEGLRKSIQDLLDNISDLVDKNTNLVANF